MSNPKPGDKVHWLQIALKALIILAILLALSIAWVAIKDEAGLSPCETGEGITAGMPCLTPGGGVE